MLSFTICEPSRFEVSKTPVLKQPEPDREEERKRKKAPPTKLLLGLMRRADIVNEDTVFKAVLRDRSFPGGIGGTGIFDNSETLQ